MDEYIEKRKVVNLLIELEKEFQQFKPFKGFEHAMYRKLCETEIAIGKLPAADVAPVTRCKDCRSYNKPKTGWCEVHLDREHPDDFCSYGERKDGGDG